MEAVKYRPIRLHYAVLLVDVILSRQGFRGEPETVITRLPAGTKYHIDGIDYLPSNGRATVHVPGWPTPVDLPHEVFAVNTKQIPFDTRHQNADYLREIDTDYFLIPTDKTQVCIAGTVP